MPPKTKMEDNTDASMPLSQSLGISLNNSSSTSSGSTDFVKKLFLMLEDNSYENIVRWTPSGESFVVLDTNEFTKEILPKHFKHSNFASFVRQLNKYDFHKVKMSNEEKQQNEYGESAWEFKHPDFRRHDREALESIKRKGPTQRRVAADEGPTPESMVRLEDSIAALQKENKTLHTEIKAINQKYTTVIESILTMKNTNDRYFRSMTTLVNTLVNHGIKLPQLDLPPIDAPPIMMQQQPQASSTMGTQTHRTSSVSSQSRTGLPQGIPGQSSSQSPPKVTGNLRPGFHVLLVEDDNVCIQLCRKFLEKYGCTVEIVSDGLTAINALEKSRYDIVFMDIIMPNLDGATATSIVRSFDNRTPIIAMTGNIDDQDLVTYLQHGMSDILAKPFTKDDLYLMLEKHLTSRTPLMYQAATPGNGGPSGGPGSGSTPSGVPLNTADQLLASVGGSGEPITKRQKI
ncbi:CYFA0S24e00474g1_1 [Cyberlindnera fabianii]|uniref:Transcription factor n=1 Tax=Cyberlindnera fabianii TaxID=36022 RepID=A0A061BHY9_CYBFA|nr:CYFA0S24e00474g1_1 [Cyberlindnera fabianii]